MKEKRSFKRFDLLSALAVLGVLLILLFESIFIFEFYNIPFEPLKRLLQPVENPASIDVEEAVIPTDVETPVPAEDNASDSLDAKEPPPVATEETLPVEAEEPVPVG